MEQIYYIGGVTSQCIPTSVPSLHPSTSPTTIKPTNDPTRTDDFTSTNDELILSTETISETIATNIGPLPGSAFQYNVYGLMMVTVRVTFAWM